MDEASPDAAKTGEGEGAKTEGAEAPASSPRAEHTNEVAPTAASGVDATPDAAADAAPAAPSSAPGPEEPAKDPGAVGAKAPPVVASGVTFGKARKLALPIVAAIALLEAGAHLYQTRPVDESGAYDRAAEYVRGSIAKNDGLVFVPDWSSRPGRMHFKELATLEREGPSDVSRSPRVFVVRNRGASGGPTDWKTIATKDFGVVTVDTLENPKPEPVLSSSLELFEQRRVEAFVHGPTEHRSCPWVRDRGSAPPWDPAVPPERFQCEGAGVGLVLTLEHDYRPRYCIAAMPMVAPRALRLRFADVHFGKKIVVHHMIQKSFEDPKYAPVTARYWVELPEDRDAERSVGTATYRDGAGFAEVTFETPDLATKTGVLAVDIQAASQQGRHYCFEVTTR